MQRVLVGQLLDMEIHKRKKQVQEFKDSQPTVRKIDTFANADDNSMKETVPFN